MAKILFLIVCWIVMFDCAKAEINVQKLFHANPPNLSPTESSQQSNSEVIDDDFNVYNEPRHDEFDYSLTKKVLIANGQKNTVVSPFLVKLLLSMLAEAAGQNTTTHRELLTVLPSIRTENQTRELYARAFGSLLKESADYQLNLGASLFVDDFIQPNQKFAAIMQAIYHSDVKKLDFESSEEAAKIINAWCANVTKNHITDIVSPGDVARAVMLLINTIYFNGYWSKPFAENETVVQNFLFNKTSVPVSFMTKTDDFFYSESDDLEAQVLRLPYKGNKFAMYIILPYKHDGLDELVHKIEAIHRTQFLMQKVEVKVSLPKFKFTNTVQLNEILKTLGIRDMFTHKASFAQLVRGNAVQDRLQVSSVLQKTGIEINEKGSTAYAATVVSLVNKFGATVEFNANRPFLFLVEDETTGTLIFSGKIVNPNLQ